MKSEYVITWFGLKVGRPDIVQPCTQEHRFRHDQPAKAMQFIMEILALYDGTLRKIVIETTASPTGGKNEPPNALSQRLFETSVCIRCGLELYHPGDYCVACSIAKDAGIPMNVPKNDDSLKDVKQQDTMSQDELDEGHPGHPSNYGDS